MHPAKTLIHSVAWAHVFRYICCCVKQQKTTIVTTSIPKINVTSTATDSNNKTSNNSINDGNSNDIDAVT